jgi:hypothetical protein
MAGWIEIRSVAKQVTVGGRDDRRDAAPWLASVVLAGAAGSLLRLRSSGPWSYDEYFHFGLARVIVAHGFPEAFPWTPFSILAERFADKEPLFHLLIAPLAGAPIATASKIVIVLGQLLFFSLVAVLLWRGRVRWGPWFVLATAGVSPILAARLGMARPHLLLLASSVALLATLFAAGPAPSRRGALLLGVVAAACGLAHVGGWIVIVFAAVYGMAGLLTRRAPREERRMCWLPVAVTAAGWLAGQLIHPNMPENFRLLWVQNAIIPFEATGAGSRELEMMLGAELLPLSAREVAQQWPAFVFFLFAAARLERHRGARTREAITLAFLAFVFLLAATIAFRRAFEMGAPLAVLAAAFAGVQAESWRRPARIAAALFVLSAIVWSQSFLVRTPSESYPRAMAEWLGRHGQAGDQIFTPQWADSAPLFYAAPQVRSMVVLDPTFFYLKDPQLFRLFVAVSYGRVMDSRRVIQDRFGARWVTILKRPVYRPLAERLEREGGARLAYADRFYEVWDLGAPPRR